ncbi:MAG: DUF4266 domain-containing protein [Aquabacterium sp.]
MRSTSQVIRLALLIGAGLAFGWGLPGCSAVQPWEKSTLGQETMRPAGPVPAFSRIDTHVYYSKEGVHGGTGVGGGGCGCN